MKHLILLALLCLSFTVSAELKQPQHVKTYIADAGESLDEFARRVAKDTHRNITMRSIEVCGEFYRYDGQLMLDTYTVDSPLRCDYLRVAAYEYTGESFHTHPDGATASFSDGDYNHPGYLAYGRQVTHQRGRGTERHVMGN